MALKTLRSLTAPLRQLDTTTARVGTVASRRLTGDALTKRRLNVWKRDPHCARCGRLVEYPRGFDLDHIVPLYAGGEDAEGNCQVLCNASGFDVYRDDGTLDIEATKGCHYVKTQEDVKTYGYDPHGYR